LIAPFAGEDNVASPMTTKSTPLLASPPAVTTTLPELAPVGTLTVMLVALQLEAVPAVTPLKVTVLAPCAAPKFVPLMITGVPGGPEVGEMLVMDGDPMMERDAWLLWVSAPLLAVIARV